METRTLLMPLSIVFLLFVAGCTTTRSAFVEVYNASSQNLQNVKVTHIYSDVFDDKQKEWAAIPHDGKSPDAYTVYYNTGFFTTGRDWWFVSWKTNDILYVTSPSNFRGTIDAIERQIVDKGAILAALPPDTSAIARKAIEEALVKTLNKVKTEGLKQHILRQEDEKEVTKIWIYDDSVVFSSPSGTSKTQFVKKE